MSTRINTVREPGSFRSDAHLNFMGGPSYDINDPFLRLRMVAASCFFGEPQYYRDPDDKSARKLRITTKNVASLSESDREYLCSTLGAISPRDWRKLSPAQVMERVIDECLDVDVERTLKVAVELRNQDMIRVTPQIIMVRAAMHKSAKGTGLVTKYAPMILRRGDEPATQLAYFLSAWGVGTKRGKVAIPTRLRKSWRAFLERLDDYKLGKYRLENRTIKTIDVVRLVHAFSPTIDKLVKGTLTVAGKTWEDVISQKGNTKEAWLEILPRMNHMGILRNLRNMTKAGVPDSEIIPALKADVAGGKQLPFRYFAAYRELERERVSGNLLDAVEQCLTESLGNVPHFPGRVMVLTDNSGSARGETTSEMGSMRIATIGNLMGVITGMAADEGYVGVFGDRLQVEPVRKTASVFDQLSKIDKIGENIGHNTETGIWLFLDRAIRNKEHWDYIFVYSDMQAGHGGLYTDGSNAPSREFVWRNKGTYVDVPKLISKYRATVNPNVKVFLVQIAGYEDTILPEFYKNTYILGGWSANILRFAAAVSGTEQVQAQANPDLKQKVANAQNKRKVLVSAKNARTRTGKRRQ